MWLALGRFKVFVAAHGMVPTVPCMGTDGGSAMKRMRQCPPWVQTGEVPMIKMRLAETCHPWSHLVEELRSVQ